MEIKQKICFDRRFVRVGNYDTHTILLTNNHPTHRVMLGGFIGKLILLPTKSMNIDCCISPTNDFCVQSGRVQSFLYCKYREQGNYMNEPVYIQGTGHTTSIVKGTKHKVHCTKLP